MHNGNDLPVWLRRPIVLVGMMGAGKTSIGQRLAIRLNQKFHDADAEIERQAGLTIQQIFTQYGEADFRQQEQRMILQLLQQSSGILATGGGAFMNSQTRAIIKDKGLSIWLCCQVGTLFERIKIRSDRPLLQSGNPVAILSQLVAIRHPTYAEADIIVMNDNNSIDATINQILQALNAWTKRDHRGRCRESASNAQK